MKLTTSKQCICRSAFYKNLAVFGPVRTTRNFVWFAKKSVNTQPFLVRTIFWTHQNFCKRNETSKIPSTSFGGCKNFVRRENPLFLDIHPSLGHQISQHMDYEANVTVWLPATLNWARWIDTEATSIHGTSIIRARNATKIKIRVIKVITIPKSLRNSSTSYTEFPSQQTRADSQYIYIRWTQHPHP